MKITRKTAQKVKGWGIKMNLKQLESLVLIIESRSFSQAANKLFLTQPTISSHISLLEKELKTQLLVRTTKDVHPTEDGKNYTLMQNKYFACKKVYFKNSMLKQKRIIY